MMAGGAWATRGWRPSAVCGCASFFHFESGSDRFGRRLTNQTTSLGGSDRETAYALGIDPMEEVIVAGDTRSTTGGVQ